MADRVGQQLGNYQLTRVVGRGGFADVYLGEHIYLKTPAAIKVLQARLSSESDMQSFLNEARTVAHLVHPNIVRVLDFGVHEEIPFLVMDYAPNGTLRQRHEKGGQLPLAVILPYVKQLAEALQYAHDEKLVHRDIKPENMLLGKRNETLLGDFGIALMAQSSRYQSTQDVVGTVAYMSPEQIQGKPRPASDQYSLAIVTYEWLSGDRPFHGSFTELCTQHMFATPPALKEKVPDINPAVEQVMSIALAKDPKQRFGSVRAFANALEQAAGGQAQASQATVYASPPPLAVPIPSQPVIPTRAPATPPPPPRYDGVPSGYPMQTPPSQHHSLGQYQQAAWEQPPRPPAYAPYQQQQPPPFAPSSVGVGRSAWSIGRREVFAALISCGLLCLFAWFIGSDRYLLYDGGTVTWIIYLAIGETIPLFFAATFGPWVGLLTAVNAFLAYYVYITHLAQGLSFDVYINRFIGPQGWLVFLVIGLAGFLIGLVVLATRGRYRNFGSALLADVFYVGTVLITTICIISVVPHPSYVNYTPLIGQVLLYALPGVVLLPIVLLIYSAIAHRRPQLG